MSKKLTAREAIAKVLSDGKTHKVPAIIEKAVPMTNLGGATPGQTIYSVLYSENKKKGTARQFVAVGRGEFKLNPSFKPVERSGSTSGAASKTTSAKASSKSKASGRKAASKRSSRKAAAAA